MKLLKFISLGILFTLFFQSEMVFGMENPEDSDEMVLVKFEGKKQEGMFLKKILECSETLKQSFFPNLTTSENYIALRGTNGKCFKADFVDFIYPLLKALSKNKENKKNALINKLEELKKDTKRKDEYERIKRSLTYLDLDRLIETPETSLKRRLEDAFSESEILEDEESEPFYKKRSLEVQTLPIILLKSESRSDAQFTMTPEALPYFSTLAFWIQTCNNNGDTEPFEVSEENVSVQSLEIINEFIPLLDPKQSNVELLESMIEKLKSLELTDEQLIDFAKSVDYLGCQPLFNVCAQIISEKIINSCKDNKSNEALRLAQSLSPNLQYAITMQVDCDLSYSKPLQSIQSRLLNAPNLDTAPLNTILFTHFAISSDGKYLASYCQFLQTIFVWDLITRQCVKTKKTNIPHVDIKIDFSSDNKTILIFYNNTILNNSTLKGYNLETDKIINVNGFIGSTVVFSPKNNMYVTGGRDLQFYSGITKIKCIKKIPTTHEGPIAAIQLSNDESVCATASRKTVKIWNLETKECLKTFKSEHIALGEVTQDFVRFSHNGKLLALGNINNIKMWDIENSEQQDLGILEEAHEIVPREITFSPADTLIAASFLSDNSSIMIWDVATRSLKYTLKHNGRVQKIYFSPNGMLLLSLSGSPKTPHSMALKIWNTVTGKCLFTYTAQKPITAAQFSDDGKSIFYCAGQIYELMNIDHDKNVKLYDKLALEKYIERLMLAQSWLSTDKKV
jgi:WD40 repeat protein